MAECPGISEFLVKSTPSDGSTSGVQVTVARPRMFQPRSAGVREATPTHAGTAGL